jgi:hypothetical protein
LTPVRNYTLLFTASVTNGTTVTSVPTVHQLNVTPVNYDFTVARPAGVHAQAAAAA